MSAFPVELLKGHDNTPEGFTTICYIRLPKWLSKKIMGRWSKADQEHLMFQVVGETEKAYQILFCKDTSVSYDFCRPTWLLDYVSKSLVELVRTDLEKYEEEEKSYYMKKLAIKESK